MKIYNYDIETVLEDEYGVPFPLRNNEKIVSHEYYDKKITYKRFMKSRKPIFLRVDLWKGSKIILRDFQMWGIGRPNAFTIICSPKFKSVLETLKLPPHRFYPAEVDVLGEAEHYFVLHFIHEYLHEMVYEQSQFCRAELLETEPVLQTYSTGEITDFDHYNSINTQLIDDMQWIFPKRIVFTPENTYDVWGLQGQIVLSEKAKQKIENAGITGVDMPELNNGIEVFVGEGWRQKTEIEENVSVVAEPSVEYKTKE